MKIPLKIKILFGAKRSEQTPIAKLRKNWMMRMRIQFHSGIFFIANNGLVKYVLK